jgi:hypothetical protein
MIDSTHPPTMEWWQEAMHKSSEPDALRLREYAIARLSSDVSWSPFVGEAEAILFERGIPY